jgi:hypothetical protein
MRAPSHLRTAARPCLLAFLAGLVACGGNSTGPDVGSVTVSPSSLAFSSVGQTQQLNVAVTDASGQPIASPSVTWRSSDASVATVSSQGLVTSVGPGSAKITASSGSVSASASVTVSQTPAAIAKVAGDGQTATPGQAVATPLTVQVNDAGGAPVAGVQVTFVVADTAGTLGSASAVTGADGRASTTFTVRLAGPQQVAAAVAGTALATAFTETGVSPFNIDLRFVTTPTAAQRAAFTAAANRWESVIVGDLPDARLNAPADSCGKGSPAINEVVDDVVIVVILKSIDGPGGVLGQSTPCYIRNSGLLTVLGEMEFDTADLDAVQSAGLLPTVVLHEMAHVLGFGTLWPAQGLLAEPASSGGTDPHFTGLNAIAQFNAVGGSSYAGAKVPVEDSGAVGTIDSHWRESVFHNELMTGFVNQGPNPLSTVTVGALQDQGYVVTYGAADAYSLMTALRALAGGTALELSHDVSRRPVHVLSETGTVLRTVER